MPFEPNKSAKELGIDTTRKFRVVLANINGDKHHLFENGDILSFKEHSGDGTGNMATFTNQDGKEAICCYFRLEYADEPKDKNPYGNLIIHTPTEEEYKMVLEKLDRSGCGYFAKNVEFSVIYTDESGEFDSFDNFESKEELLGKRYNKGRKFITANEFLGEEEKEQGDTFKEAMWHGHKFHEELEKEQSRYNTIMNMEIDKRRLLCNPPIMIDDTNIKNVIEYLSNYNKPKNKFMSTIKKAFKSKENKALEYFNLGSTEGLNESGRAEFVDFIFETGNTDKKEFFKKIVEAYKEDTK